MGEVITSMCVCIYLHAHMHVCIRIYTYIYSLYLCIDDMQVHVHLSVYLSSLCKQRYIGWQKREMDTPVYGQKRKE